MRYRAWLGGAAVCLVVLTGCSQGPAGAAAVVGEQRIELSEVDGQVQAINTIVGRPAGQADADLTTAVVRNNIVYALLEQAAADAGVSVSQTAIDERLANQIEFVGSQAMLEQQAASAGVAPGKIATDIEVSLLAQQLAGRLGGGDAPEEQQQRLIAEIQRYSEDVGVLVNPRFGVWDANSLALTADPAAPSRPAQLGQLGAP